MSDNPDRDTKNVLRSWVQILKHAWHLDRQAMSDETWRYLQTCIITFKHVQLLCHLSMNVLPFYGFNRPHSEKSCFTVWIPSAVLQFCMKWTRHFVVVVCCLKWKETDPPPPPKCQLCT
jgi:hypothetical protein